MRIAVIGAGVIGVTSAYELAADGHAVTVFERRGSVAVEASFAHAGLVGPGSVWPWNSPSMPQQLLRQMFSSGVRARFQLHPNWLQIPWPWLWRWRKACHAKTQRRHQLRLQSLALFSRTQLQRLTHTLALEYERTSGHLVLLRSPEEADFAQDMLARLGEQSVPFKWCDETLCRSLEPGLSPNTLLHGGIHIPGDEASNCRQFALLLRAHIEKMGGVFRFHSAVLSIRSGRQAEITSLHTPHDETSIGTNAGEVSRNPRFEVTQAHHRPECESFDAVLLCAAMGAPALLAPAGIKLPMVAMHGHSITMPLRHQEAHADTGPRIAITDLRHQVTMSRLGSRLRVSGGAELGGSAALDREAPGLAKLHQVLDDWYPGAAHTRQAQYWRGSSWVLPDGMPLLGACRLPGIWLNLGHGSAGWALACGSARLVADAIAKRPASIDTDPLSVRPPQS